MPRSRQMNLSPRASVFWLLCSGNNPECLVGMRTHLTTVSLFYYSVDIKASRPFFWDRISWVLSGFELKLDLYHSMTLNSWSFYHDLLPDSWANGHDSEDQTRVFWMPSKSSTNWLTSPAWPPRWPWQLIFCWKLTIFCCCVSRFFCSAFPVVFECVIKRLLQSDGLLWFCEFIQWRWHLAKHLFANLPLTNCMRHKEQPYSFAWARSCITCGLQKTDHWRMQLCDQLCI